ncbi:MAG: GLUG motif-containing protein, partial [Saccharofermentanales bacterium]
MKKGRLFGGRGFLSVVLSVLLLFSLNLPVFAVDNGGNVCEIDGAGYTTLGEALDDVSSGQTIKLLQDIEHNSGIVIIDKRITFDLNGFDLNVVNSVEVGETQEICGLYVVGDAAVELENEGELNVFGKYGVFAAGIDDPTDPITNNNTVVNVTNAAASGDDCIGVISYNAVVTVKGDIATNGSYCIGIDANFEYAEVIVKGSVDVTGEQGIGVISNSAACIIVEGSINVNGRFSYGIRTYDEAQATVNGDVTASGEFSIGVCAANGYINVDGDVTGDTIGAEAMIYSSISILGNVRSLFLREFSYGVLAEEGSNIYVSGDVESQGIGVLIPRLSSTAACNVVIYGVIEAPSYYIQMDEFFYDFEDGIPVYDSENADIMCYRKYERKGNGVHVAMFAGGIGTVEDPYLVRHTHHLMNIPCYPQKNYLQTEDIEIIKLEGGPGWDPICEEDDPFEGSFNGDMHTISGLSINQPKTWNYRYPAGLFGYTGETADIFNLILDDVDIEGCYYVGGLVGSNNGRISNVTVTDAYVQGECYTGGLAGFNSGTITDSVFEGTVIGIDDIEYGDWTGGLVGYNDMGTISNCRVEAQVASEGSYVGGLVGENFAGEAIRQSSFAGEVYGYRYCGGLVGCNSVDITDCYAMGIVEGDRYLGGLLGASSASITNSYAAGMVIDTGVEERESMDVGGLIGSSTDATVVNSFWDSETSCMMNSDGGTGKTTAEMKEQETYTAWDFQDVWDIDESTNYGYPFLRSQQTNGQPPEPPVPPVLSETGTAAGGITPTGADLLFTSDKSGTYYYLIYEAVHDAPDSTAIKAQGDAPAKGTGSATGMDPNSVPVTGLSPSTAYKAYIIVEDGDGNISDIAVISFTTADEEQPNDHIFREITDSETGVIVSGNIHKDAVLTIGSKALHDEGTCETCDAIRNEIAGTEFIALFVEDIALSHSFDGSLTISIPVGAQYNGKTATIRHCSNGILQTYTAVIQDGKVTFTVTGLSPVAVLVAADTEETPVPPVLSETGTAAGGITPTGADLLFTSDKSGTYYYLIYEAEHDAPDSAAIKAQGDAPAKGTGSATGMDPNSVP